MENLLLYSMLEIYYTSQRSGHKLQHYKDPGQCEICALFFLYVKTSSNYCGKSRVFRNICGVG